MMTSKTVGVTVLCAILGAGTLQAAGTGDPQAGKPETGPGPAIVKALSRLNLTPEQKSAIANAVKQHRNANRAAIDQVIEARKQLFARIHADVIDEAAIRSASRIVSQKEEDLAVCRAQTVAAVKSVFTPDQIETFNGLRTEATDHIEAQRGRLFAMVDAWVDAHDEAN
jgi:Spy/CpxP family protein refolding chaperone